MFPQNSDGTYDYCNAYEGTLNQTNQCSFNDETTIRCTPDATILYGPFQMENTIATEFNLICSVQYQVSNTTLLRVQASS